jgi:endonuclease/exonuclease/phosphatase family metal-dependent hydrolase
MGEISFATINVENFKHVTSVRNFLLERRPDVVCLQELLKSEYEDLKTILRMEGFFVPLTLRPREDKSTIEPEGLGILTTGRIIDSKDFFYRGDSAKLKEWNKESPDRLLETVYAAVALIQSEIKSKLYSFATTHFTWTPDGKASDMQRVDMGNLLKILADINSFVLCGDFNAPRGGEIFTQLSSRYKDNIPERFDSSLDPKLHRRGDLHLMVDGVFSTADFDVTDVDFHAGVSDHFAITGKVNCRSDAATK